MIAYFRGYCRERLGQSGAADYKIASKLPTSYVFPSSAEELIVLNAAVRTNPQDATAQYLLGHVTFLPWIDGLSAGRVVAVSQVESANSRPRCEPGTGSAAREA